MQELGGLKRSKDRHIAELVSACVVAEVSSGQRVALHIPSGRYLQLDGSASTIVDLLAEYEDVPLASRALSAKFSLPIERAESDVARVVEMFSTLRASRKSPIRLPRPSGITRVVSDWWSLRFDLRCAVVKAAIVVSFVEIGLRTTNIDALAKRMHVPLAPRSAHVPKTGADDFGALTASEQRSFWACGWVLNRWSFEGTCLRRALVKGYFLRRRNPALLLGMADNGETAHAWVEAGDLTFDALEGTGTFVAPGGPLDRPKF